MVKAMVTRQVFAKQVARRPEGSPQWDPNIATQSSKYLIVKWQVPKLQILGTFRQTLTLS